MSSLIRVRTKHFVRRNVFATTIIVAVTDIYNDEFVIRHKVRSNPLHVRTILWFERGYCSNNSSLFFRYEIFPSLKVYDVRTSYVCSNQLPVRYAVRTCYLFTATPNKPDVLNLQTPNPIFKQPLNQHKLVIHSSTSLSFSNYKYFNTQIQDEVK